MNCLHQEHLFEKEICEHLAKHGWLYDEGSAATGYDRANALHLPDLFAWLESTQPESWQALTKTYGSNLSKTLSSQIRKSMNNLSALHVLRQGIDLHGLPPQQRLELVQFKPAFGLNPKILKRYEVNRLRVVRQLRYSLNESRNAIDLVLLVNGIPVATVELKSNFTQSVHDAIDQYRSDRNPYSKNGQVEPLLAFPGGALVHFAVSQNEVQMTTKLDGDKTHFLPFNRGNNGGAGNAPNPHGYATSYLWEEVWEWESWLDILARYSYMKRHHQNQPSSLIFPRYHQLDVTRKIVADVQEKGAGQRYLIQHSAGSGKTHSIAWTAHFLAELHNVKHQKIFDSVLVISDRNVIDLQLQDAISEFQRTNGAVEIITNENNSKSAQLSQALKNNKKIIVCTIQTFPFALEAVQKLAATESKHFAVIIDEAHSSQTGEAAISLNKVLSSQKIIDGQNSQDIEEIDEETFVNACVETETGAETKNVTYIAFTATPKPQTIEIFGRENAAGLPEPFHIYSMRQAIEEGFILDVLKNYTVYEMAFRLANDVKSEREERVKEKVNRDEAMRKIMQWVRINPHTIAEKVKIVIEHFSEKVQPLLDGHAKAMIVVNSRQEAVRWQKAVRAYIKQKNKGLGVLVAFSGDVDDPESFAKPVSETSKELNPGLNGRDISEVFAKPEYQFLIAANKFQVGFNQPLLCGMYVDKALGGIQAVQTLSRLNRAYPGKDTTYILDFVNDAKDILKAFKIYYETAELREKTDPNLIHELRMTLNASRFYDQFEVNRVAEIETDREATQKQLIAVLEPVAQRLLTEYKQVKKALTTAREQDDQAAVRTAEEQLSGLLQFKKDMQVFNRLYVFLSQIFVFDQTDIEKCYLFYKRLVPLLEFGRERDGVDFSGLVLTHHSLRQISQQSLDLTQGNSLKLSPIGASQKGFVREEKKEFLNKIIEHLNGQFEGVTDQDKLLYVNGEIRSKLMENKNLRQQAVSNSKQRFSDSPDLTRAITDAIMAAGSAYSKMSEQALNSRLLQETIRKALLETELYEFLCDQNTKNFDKYESIR